MSVLTAPRRVMRRQTRPFGSRLPWLAVMLVVVAFMALQARPGSAASSPSRPARAAAPEPIAPAPQFRLGTAARPFGWATAVGDVNADGSPDLIVADRMTSAGRGSYRLAIEVSGESPIVQTLQVAEEGLSLRLVDVDHDSDLDIVLASALSRRTVDVWLNDGAGHFTRATGSIPVPVSWSAQSADDAAAAAALDGVDLPSRRLAAALTAYARAPGLADGRARIGLVDVADPASRVFSPASPRAPPTDLPVRS